jgi:hypothetical protein
MTLAQRYVLVGRPCLNALHRYLRAPAIHGARVCGTKRLPGGVSAELGLKVSLDCQVDPARSDTSNERLNLSNLVKVIPE